MSDVYDFSIDDDAESSGEQARDRDNRHSNKSGRLQSSTRGASLSAGGSFSRNASRASALDALSPPTPTDSSASENEFNVGTSVRGGRARSSSGGIGVTASSTSGRPGSFARSGQGSVASGSGRASLDVSSASGVVGGSGGGGLSSIEERVAARLASLQVERLAKLSSLGGSVAAQTASADVSAISGVNSSGGSGGLASGFVTPAGINTSGVSTMRAAVTQSVNSSANAGARRTANNSISRPEVILSPLSAGGDLDSSSSVDMSSADFQVGAIAARALAARRAASVALNAASQGKTVIEASLRRDESDAEHSDEGENDTNGDGDTQETPVAEKTDPEEEDEEGDDGYENDDGDESSIDLQSTFTHAPSLSPPRAIVPVSALLPASSNLTAAVTASTNSKKDPSHLTFAELAMMMREEAAFSRKMASTTSTSAPSLNQSENRQTLQGSASSVVITSATHGGASSITSSQTSDCPPPPPDATPLRPVSESGVQNSLSSSQVFIQQQEYAIQSTLYQQQQQLIQTNALAAVTRSLRAAAAAALSKQLQSAAAAQRSVIGNEALDAMVPSTILRDYVDSDVFSRRDSNIQREEEEIEDNAGVTSKVSAKPPRAPIEPVPLRAQNIRAAVERVGLGMSARSSQSSSRRSSRSSSLDRVPISSNIEGNDINAFDRKSELIRSPPTRPKLPFPVRMTRSQKQRAIASREYRRSSDEAAARSSSQEPCNDEENDKSEQSRNSSIKFSLVTKEGEYVINDDGSSQGPTLMSKDRIGIEKPRSKSPQRPQGSDHPSPRYNRAQLHASIYGPVGSTSVDISRGRPVSRQPRDDNVSVSPPPPPPPIDSALANALIADAAAARFAAETRVSELASTVTALEAKLKQIEDQSNEAKDAPSSPATAFASSPEPSLQLYSLLREAISQLTVFQQHQHRGVNDFLIDDSDSGRALHGGALHTTSRFMKERGGPRREWAPLGPTTGSSGAVANYFEEVPISQIVSAADADGFRAFVPLALVQTLQRELATQEKMITAYHSDNQRLRGNLSRSSETAVIGNDEKDKVTQTQLKSNTIQQSTVIETAMGSSSSEIIEKLRSDLADARENHLVREGELAQEVERLRRAKIDLECRANGVDMEAVARDSEEVLKMRAESAAMKIQHEKEVAALNTKLAWYRDNQTIVDTDTSTIAQQAETIRELQDRLRMAITSSPRGLSLSGSPRGKVAGPSSSTSPNSLIEASSPSSPMSGRLARSGLPSDPERDLALAQKRIKQLESDLRIAEDAMAKRHPDSIANLIREAKGSTQAVGEPAVVLAELEKLKAETAESEDGQDRRLRALRQEHERLRAEFEKREAALKDEMSGLRVRLAAFGDSGAGSPGPGGSIDEGISRRELALRGRVKELETELERIRAFYAKKVREDRISPNGGSSPSQQIISRIAATTANVYMTSRSSPSLSQQGVHNSLSHSPAGGGESEDTGDNAHVVPTPEPSAPTASINADSSLDLVPKNTKKSVSAPIPRRLSVSSDASAKAKTQISPHDSIVKKGKSGTATSAPTGVLTPKVSLQSSPRPSTSLTSKTKSVPPRKGEKSSSPTNKISTQDNSSAQDEEPALDVLVSLPLSSLPPPESISKPADEGFTTQALLAQVARLEAENSRIIAEKAKQVEAALGTPEGRASSHVIYLQRQVEQLHAAVGVLEARADSREAELARAELRALHAKEAGEILARAHFAEALQAKDDALRAARNELEDLVGTIKQIQGEQVEVK